MKKIYLLSLLCCLRFVAMSQTTTVITPAGTTGSFKTGSSDGVTRTDDGIVSQEIPSFVSGYCVFDLTGIPVTAKVMACDLGFYLNAISTSASASNCKVYGFVGDLSTVSTPATLNTDMHSGLPIISPSDFGTAVGSWSKTSAGIVAFIQANLGGKVSISWTGGGIVSYNITGESGVSPLPIGSSPANHKPYLNITYCSQPTITATATPNPVCENTILSLNQTSGGTDGSTITYSWTGPGGYTSPLTNPTLIAAMGSAGVYSVTLTNTCAIPAPAVSLTVAATTSNVIVNPAPAPITSTVSASVICQPLVGSSMPLSDATLGLTWSSSNTNIATVSPSGVVNAGTLTGPVTISYTYPATGCYALFPMRVNARPAAISGVDQVCQTRTTFLTESSGGGTWGSSTSSVATVVAGTVTGVNPGTATIAYTIPGCPAATYSVTVNPTPDPIAGGTNTCIGTPTVFSDALGGGTWSTSNTEAVFGVGGPNELTAVIPGTATITYTSTHGCTITLLVNVDPAVSPIGLATGYKDVICENGPITVLSDGTSGGFWTTASTTATVDFSGNVSGIGGGTASITYNQGACQVFYTITVNPAPLPITGPSPVCQYDSFYLSDLTSGDKWTSTDLLSAIIDSNTGFVHTMLPVTGGMDFIYTDRTSSCFSKFKVVINPSPDGTISTTGGMPTTFCTGEGVEVGVPSGSLGETYQWYSNSVPIPAPLGTVNTYSTSATQTLTVKIVNSYGCVTNSVPVLIISGISPDLLVKGSDTFCQGGNAILTADAHGSVGLLTYQWTRNGAYITGANAATYYATTSGVYDCIVDVSGFSGTCSVTTGDAKLLVHPAPTPTIGYATRKLHADAGYSHYQWYLNTIAVPGAISSTYVPAKNGSYRVLVTDTSGCTGYSSDIIITTAGIGQVSAADVSIYPNPANSILHIESPVTVSAVITGIDGKTVLSQVNAKDINISNLANGMYIIMLFDEQGERLTVQKLIKE